MNFSKKTLFISRLSILIALTFVIQIAGFPQPVTGPLVNAMLLISTAFLGCTAGIVLGIITPLLALIRGLLPPVLAPVVPFIIIGNIILVFLFHFIINNVHFNLLNFIKKYIAIVIAAFGKYIFLFLSVKIILPLIFNFQIAEKIVIIMTTPQLITAIAGGIIALIIIEILKKTGLESKIA